MRRWRNTPADIGASGRCKTQKHHRSFAFAQYSKCSNEFGMRLLSFTRRHTSAIHMPCSLINLCIAFALLVAGCGRSSGQPKQAEGKETVRMDAAPIVKRLPKLGHLKSVWWISTQVTTDSVLSPPG